MAEEHDEKDVVSSISEPSHRGSVYISEKVKGTRSQSMKLKEAEWKSKVTQNEHITEYEVSDQISREKDEEEKEEEKEGEEDKLEHEACEEEEAVLDTRSEKNKEKDEEKEGEEYKFENEAFEEEEAVTRSEKNKEKDGEKKGGEKEKEGEEYKLENEACEEEANIDEEEKNKEEEEEEKREKGEEENELENEVYEEVEHNEKGNNENYEEEEKVGREDKLENREEGFEKGTVSSSIANRETNVDTHNEQDIEFPIQHTKQNIHSNHGNKVSVECGIGKMKACQLVPSHQDPLQNLEDFLNDDDDDDVDDVNDVVAGGVSVTTGPQTNEEVDEMVAKRRKEKKKLKKEKKERKALDVMKKQTNLTPKQNTGGHVVMSKEQEGMIRYSGFARVHIGEVANPKIGELPSRTASLPMKAPLYEPEVIPGVRNAKKLVTKIWNDESSSDDSSDSDSDSSNEEEENVFDEDDEEAGLLGAIKEGVGVISEIVKPIIEKKSSPYVDMSDSALEAAAEQAKREKEAQVAKRKKRKRKIKKQKKLAAMELENKRQQAPRRPLEAMEIEEGKRLQETTPLSLRIRQYQAIFSREIDCFGRGTVVILGYRLTQGQLFVGALCVIFFLVYSLSSQGVIEEAPLQQVDVGRDVEPVRADNQQTTYRSRGSYVP